MEHKNIDELEDILSQTAYKELVQKLVKTKKIVLISARMSSTLLPYTTYILNKIRNNVIQVTPHDPAWDTLTLEEPENSLIFALVFPRYPIILINKLQELKEHGFSIAAITDSMMSPIFNLANPLLPIPITISSIFDIYSTPLLFINLLMRDVATSIEGLKQRLDGLENIESINHIYYHKS